MFGEENRVKRLCKLELFVEYDDKDVEKLMAAAKKLARGSDPEEHAEEWVDTPGSAIEEITRYRMMGGRPPLECIENSIEMYGVPMPTKKEREKTGLISWREYHDRFLEEHPPILDEDDFPTGEFRGYPSKAK